MDWIGWMGWMVILYCCDTKSIAQERCLKCFKRICLCQIHVFVCYIVVTHNVDLNMIGGCWSLLIRKGKIRTCPPRLICRLRPAAFFRRSQIAEPAEYTWPALSTTCCPPLPPPVLMTNYIFWSFFFVNSVDCLWEFPSPPHAIQHGVKIERIKDEERLKKGRKVEGPARDVGRRESIGKLILCWHTIPPGRRPPPLMFKMFKR